MKEFGSDFHQCNAFIKDLTDNVREQLPVRYYASGSHALADLINQQQWKRIWIPAYFCYEVINRIKKTQIKVMYYNDYPQIENSCSVINSLPFEAGDAILRMNYFGLRKWSPNRNIQIPVIEDHTHNLNSVLVSESNADWCFASIRKILPVAAGGILWSPTNRNLPEPMIASRVCEEMAGLRYEAMLLKSDYLDNHGEKEKFRAKFLQSEEMLERLELTGMDRESKQIFHEFDIATWNRIKKDNWILSYKLLKNNFDILTPQDIENQTPFSLVFACDSSTVRDRLRQYLISHNIYPAILWQMPSDSPFRDALDFSQRMLSVHCDARYSAKDIQVMCKIINSYYDTNR